MISITSIQSEFTTSLLRSIEFARERPPRGAIASARYRNTDNVKCWVRSGHKVATIISEDCRGFSSLLSIPKAASTLNFTKSSFGRVHPCLKIEVLFFFFALEEFVASADVVVAFVVAKNSQVCSYELPINNTDAQGTR